MIKPFLLRTALAILAFSVAMASQPGSNAQDELQTPQRAAMSVVVEPTPGQRLVQRQAQTLTRDNFVSALDPQLVDSWQINWNVFQDQSLPFDASQKRHDIRFISNRMKVMPSSKVDGPIRDLYFKVLGLQGDAEGIHAERLDTLALAYFSKLFPEANLTPEMKLGGVQLGERIVVNQDGLTPLTYHVKTHTLGQLSSNSTGAKTVNPQELMAYSVLEHLGVGCESHFFERSPVDVYIATLDAGTGGQFTLFDVMSGQTGLGGNEVVGKRLAGSLMDISRHFAPSSATQIEADITKSQAAQNFIREMAKLDVITRIFKLHDLLNNPGNFGFFESNQLAPTIKVIDFRVMDDPIYNTENYNPFGGFLAGNGLYNYACSHKTMRYVLHDRLCSARIEMARSIMQSGLLNDLERAIRLAYRNTLSYLQRDVFNNKRQELEQQLQEYHKAVINNISFFNKKLMTWEPEPTTKHQRARTPDSKQGRTEGDRTRSHRRE